MYKTLTLAFKKIYWFKRNLLTKIGFKRNYQINGTTIKIDYNHLLPNYEKNFPNYDRFLSHLVKYLENDSIVVDVGANVGDTLLKMVNSNDRLQYICIEPDDNFYSDLVHNCEIVKNKKTKLKVTTLKKYVGLDSDYISLVNGTNGSKRSIPGSGSARSDSLDNIFNELNISQNKLSLIKSDVDGYDWDVIKSANSLLNNNPYIYFECFYENMSQLNNFKAVIGDLFEKKYDHFSFFDNYGNHMCCIDNLKNVYELLDYIKKQNFSKSTRTIFYYDILAYSKKDKIKTDQILLDYNND